MDNEIINDRLKQYKLLTLEDEENAIKEILQELALYALSRTDFFSKGLFQGGTALRILYQLPRFSEDLDFILKHADDNFRWEGYIDQIASAMRMFNIETEIIDRTKVDKTVQKLFLKDNSIGKVLNLKFRHPTPKKLMIKFEVDTNPPTGANEEIKFIDFPLDFAISAQDLPSNFAGKCHALLCREYIKGRDWFDFSWYISKKIAINFTFLSSAINQNGPWKDQSIQITKSWLVDELTKKINLINWEKAKLEVERFLNPDYQQSLDLWSKEFFIDKANKLGHYLES